MRSTHHQWLIALLAIAASAAPAAAISFVLPEAEVFSITNADPVSNNPTAPSEFTTPITRHISRIRTYHWNGGAGATPGTIWLADNTGTLVYGPWTATGSPGQGGAPDAYWDAAPDLDLPAGTYRVVDSDTTTRSHNTGSGGRGMTWVFATDTVTVPDPPDLGAPASSGTIASIAWSVNDDVRTSATVWTAPAPATVIETTLEIPTDTLDGGSNLLILAPAGAADGDPSSFGFFHASIFVQADHLPEVAEIRWSIDGDPRTEGTTHVVTTPGQSVEQTLAIPTAGLDLGLHRLTLIGLDDSGAEGVPQPALFTVLTDPLPEIAEVRWSVDGDPRTEGTSHVVTTPGQSVEQTLAIPTAGLDVGLHRLTLIGLDDSGTEGVAQPALFTVLTDPLPEVAEVRWSVDGDPRTTGTSHVITTPGQSVEQTLAIPTAGLDVGLHRLTLLGLDANDAEGVAQPALFSVLSTTPLSISALEGRVIDGVGNPAGSPRLQPIPGAPTVFDGTFEWPSFRVRQSGDYQILIAPLSEGKIPGRFATASFTQIVPPYAEAIYAEFWPPENYPDQDLTFAGDANHDGVANGTAFALGISLSNPAAVSQLPSAEFEPDAMLFTYRQRAGGSGVPGEGYTADGIEYRIELSPTLTPESWLNDPARISLVEAPIDNGDGTETVTLRIERSTAEADFARLMTKPAPP